MRASDYASADILVDVTLADGSEVTSQAPECDCCGNRLNWETFDPAGFRGVLYYYTEVTLRLRDAECPDEEPEVESFRAHDECATDFQDAVRLARASASEAKKEAA